MSENQETVRRNGRSEGARREGAAENQGRALSESRASGPHAGSTSSPPKSNDAFTPKDPGSQAAAERRSLAVEKLRTCGWCGGETFADMVPHLKGACGKVAEATRKLLARSAFVACERDGRLCALPGSAKVRELLAKVEKAVTAEASKYRDRWQQAGLLATIGILMRVWFLESTPDLEFVRAATIALVGVSVAVGLVAMWFGRQAEGFSRLCSQLREGIDMGVAAEGVGWKAPPVGSDGDAPLDVQAYQRGSAQPLRARDQKLGPAQDQRESTRSPSLLISNPPRKVTLWDQALNGYHWTIVKLDTQTGEVTIDCGADRSNCGGWTFQAPERDGVVVAGDVLREVRKSYLPEMPASACEDECAFQVLGVPMTLCRLIDICKVESLASNADSFRALCDAVGRELRSWCTQNRLVGGERYVTKTPGSFYRANPEVIVWTFLLMNPTHAFVERLDDKRRGILDAALSLNPEDFVCSYGYNYADVKKRLGNSQMEYIYVVHYWEVSQFFRDATRSEIDMDYLLDGRLSISSAEKMYAAYMGCTVKEARARVQEHLAKSAPGLPTPPPGGSYEIRAFQEKPATVDTPSDEGARPEPPEEARPRPSEEAQPRPPEGARPRPSEEAGPKPPEEAGPAKTEPTAKGRRRRSKGVPMTLYSLIDICKVEEQASSAGSFEDLCDGVGRELGSWRDLNGLANRDVQYVTTSPNSSYQADPEDIVWAFLLMNPTCAFVGRLDDRRRKLLKDAQSLDPGSFAHDGYFDWEEVAARLGCSGAEARCVTRYWEVRPFYRDAKRSKVDLDYLLGKCPSASSAAKLYAAYARCTAEEAEARVQEHLAKGARGLPTPPPGGSYEIRDEQTVVKVTAPKEDHKQAWMGIYHPFFTAHGSSEAQAAFFEWISNSIYRYALFPAYMYQDRHVEYGDNGREDFGRETADEIRFVRREHYSYHDGGGGSEDSLCLRALPKSEQSRRLKAAPKSLMTNDHYRQLHMPPCKGYWGLGGELYVKDPFGMSGIFMLKVTDDSWD